MYEHSTLPFKILFGIVSTAKCVLLMRSRLSPLDKRFNYKYTAEFIKWLITIDFNVREQIPICNQNLQGNWAIKLNIQRIK